MRMSKLFSKTRRETPREVDNISTALLIRGGFVEKIGAGIFAFLPLGLKVLNKIDNIIREEMNNIGGQELLLPALHPIKYWQTTGRDKVEAGFKLGKDEETEYILGWTHEEIVTPVMKKSIQSYKDLPQAVYQIQFKFRNEPRAKSGLLRGREFSMKDLYSFHVDQEDLDNYYVTVKEAYEKILKRLGLAEITYYTYASGGDFSEFSHEFQTATDTGEDTIYVCEKCQQAVNKEIKDKVDVCPGCGGKDFRIKKAVEVANIFKLGTKYTDAFGMKYRDIEGKEQPVYMGCYGFGSTRVMGTVAEIFNDEYGLVWPQSLSPFDIHLVDLGTGKGEDIYKELTETGFEVLLDDREASAGEKFADADLIGIPWRVVISKKTLEKDSVEIQKRGEKESQLVAQDKLTDIVKERLANKKI